MDIDEVVGTETKATKSPAREANTSAEDEYVTVKTAAYLTRRSEQIIWRWIREGRLQKIAHPENSHIHLIRWMDVIQVHFDQKQKGRVKKDRVLTRESDGKIIHIRA